MKEYKAEIVNGHILVNDDRGSKILLDTGSPLSFHAERIVALNGKTYPVRTSLGSADSRYVTDNVGTAVSGLVGMDILGESNLLIDVPGGRVVLGCPTDGMTRIASSQGAYVFMEMEIRGQMVKVILDTGAPISYVSSSLTEGLEVVDVVDDFNPAVPGGKYRVPRYEFSAAFAGQEFRMRAGHLPPALQMAVSILGVKGVVGMEVLKHQPVLIADGVWVNN